MDPADPFSGAIKTSQSDRDADRDCENRKEPGGEVVDPVEAHIRVRRLAFGVWRLRNQNDFTDVFAAFHPFVGLRRFCELEHAIDYWPEICPVR